MNTAPKHRLEYLRKELRAERISYGELAELQSLAPHIAPDDVELREAAGLPEFPRYIVDGLQFDDPESAYLGDGNFPPFVIFDQEAQENLPDKYQTREDAQKVANNLNLAIVD